MGTMESVYPALYPIEKYLLDFFFFFHFKIRPSNCWRAARANNPTNTSAGQIRWANSVHEQPNSTSNLEKFAAGCSTQNLQVIRQIRPYTMSKLSRYIHPNWVLVIPICQLNQTSQTENPQTGADRDKISIESITASLMKSTRKSTNHQDPHHRTGSIVCLMLVDGEYSLSHVTIS